MKRAFKVIMLSLVFTLMMGICVQAKPKLNHSKLTLYKGVERQLTVKNSISKVKWSSSNSKVAKVDKNGVVTGKKLGKATITAKVGSKKLKCNVKVVKPEYEDEEIYDDGTIRVTCSEIYSEKETGDVYIEYLVRTPVVWYRNSTAPCYYEPDIYLNKVKLENYKFLLEEDYQFFDYEGSGVWRCCVCIDGEVVNKKIKNLENIEYMEAYFNIDYDPVEEDYCVCDDAYYVACNLKLNKYVTEKPLEKDPEEVKNPRKICGKNGVKIYGDGIQKLTWYSGYQELEIDLYVENKNKDKITIELDRCDINGYNINEAWMYKTIPGNSKTHINFTIDNRYLRNNNVSIDNLKSLKLKFNVSSRNNEFKEFTTTTWTWKWDNFYWE